MNAWRMARREPGFALTVTLVLALGIGLNCAVFSLVETALLRPLPYPAAEQLYYIWGRNPGRQQPKMSISVPDFVEFAGRARQLSGVVCHASFLRTLTGGGDPVRVYAGYVSWNYFQTLGVAPLHGRLFTPEESVDGRDRVALLSYGFWQRQFGGDKGILGRTILLDGEPNLVAGVLPDVPGGVLPSELFLPQAFGEMHLTARESRFLTVLGRARPGVSRAQAEQEIRGLGEQLAAEHPESNRGWEFFLTPAHEQATGDARLVLSALLAAAWLVLLITAANVGGVLLARAAVRARQNAIRAAIGGGAWRIARQVATESAALAAAGAVAGLALGYAGLRAIRAWAPPGVPRADLAGLNLTVAAYTVLAGAAAAVVFGLAPAISAFRLNLARTLAQETRGGTGGAHRSRARTMLIVVEVTVTSVLLVAAGLILHSLTRLYAVDPGYRPENVLTFRTRLPETVYPDAPRRARYVRETLERLRAVPGVRAAGLTTALPMMQVNWNTRYVPAERAHLPPAEQDTASYNAVSPGYFETLGIRLKQGRFFTARDDANAPPVVVVSEALARKCYPGGQAVGRRIVMTSAKTEFNAEIVGVAGDVRHLRLDEPPRVAVYQPHAQMPWPFLAYAVRTEGRPEALARAVEKAMFTVDPNLPMDRVKSLETLTAEALARERLALTLLLVFAAVAVGLAAIGMYSVLANSVTARTREIGIRMALGATPGGVTWLVLREGLLLAAAGLAAGLAITPLTVRHLGDLLHLVTPLDPLTYAGVAGVVLAMTLAACWLPVRRALRVKPAEALRQG